LTTFKLLKNNLGDQKPIFSKRLGDKIVTVFKDLSDISGSEPSRSFRIGEEVFGCLVRQPEVAERHVAAAKNDFA